MEHLIKSTLAKLNSPQISFADIRITKTDSEGIFFQNGFLRDYSSSMDSLAIGIRVLIDGCWGFAGSRNLSPENIDKLIAKAKSNALSGALFSKEKVSFTNTRELLGTSYMICMRVEISHGEEKG